MNNIIIMPETADETLKLKNKISTASDELEKLSLAFDTQPPETANKFYNRRWDVINAKQDEFNGYYSELSERIKNLKECKRLIAKNNESLKELKKKMNRVLMQGTTLEGLTKKLILDNPDIYKGEIDKKQNRTLRFVLGVESPPSPTKSRSTSPPKTRSRSPSKGGRTKQKRTLKRR
jgi:hypothetical protein